MAQGRPPQRSQAFVSVRSELRSLRSSVPRHSGGPTCLTTNRIVFVVSYGVCGVASHGTPADLRTDVCIRPHYEQDAISVRSELRSPRSSVLRTPTTALRRTYVPHYEQDRVRSELRSLRSSVLRTPTTALRRTYVPHYEQDSVRSELRSLRSSVLRTPTTALRRTCVPHYEQDSVRSELRSLRSSVPRHSAPTTALRRTYVPHYEQDRVRSELRSPRSSVLRTPTTALRRTCVPHYEPISCPLATIRRAG